MTRVLYPHLLALMRSGELDAGAVDRVLAASTEGYPFPTNLDRDPPLGGLAPASAQHWVRQALDEDWSADRLGAHLDALALRRFT
jgi:hypothetical protein